ncbi:glycoside hydrolase family 2 [Streptomyces hirsutus]
MTVESEGASPKAAVEAVARDARGKVVGKVSGPANRRLHLPVTKQHLAPTTPTSTTSTSS